MKKDGFYITSLEQSDFDDWVTFSLALFTNTSKEEMVADLKRISQLAKYQTFIAKMEETAIGYITVTLRTDHVEGASTSPVGYMEAIYILPEHRNQGVAKALYDRGEKWCKEQGCSEMGSDTWHWNKEAQVFHEKLGFNEEDVLVHFYKKIEP